MFAEHDLFERCAVADTGDDERARPRERFRAAGFGRADSHKRGEFGAIPIPDHGREAAGGEAAHDCRAENAGPDTADAWFFSSHFSLPGIYR